MNPKLTPDRLRRRAVIYVRQSSPTQLAHNHESRRRQYALAEQARQMGFAMTEVIDEDLGRSGSGWSDQDLSISSPLFVPARWVRCSA
jgi:hypothetical protein